MKNIISFLFLILILINVNAGIVDYNVAREYPLDKPLTIEGKVSPGVENVRCSFKIYDRDNNFIKRLTDEFTTSSGLFSSSYLVLREPTFYRGLDYNMVTDCDGNFATKTFRVVQRIPISNTIQQELLYILDIKNQTAFFIGGTVLMIIILIILMFYYFYKKGKRIVSR